MAAIVARRRSRRKRGQRRAMKAELHPACKSPLIERHSEGAFQKRGQTALSTGVVVSAVWGCVGWGQSSQSPFLRGRWSVLQEGDGVERSLSGALQDCVCHE